MSKRAFNSRDESILQLSFIEETIFLIQNNITFKKVSMISNNASDPFNSTCINEYPNARQGYE